MINLEDHNIKVSTIGDYNPVKQGTLGYQINVQQTLLFFEKKYQIQNFEIFNLVCFTSYS